MLADGVFAFTRNVDAVSFKVLCTILAVLWLKLRGGLELVIS